MSDEEPPISYRVLQPGARVVTSDGEEIGKVREVLDNQDEDIFDGLVIEGRHGQRFVDAPEVARIAERRVTLAIPAERASTLGPPEPGTPVYHADVGAGRLRRLFGGGWRRKR